VKYTSILGAPDERVKDVFETLFLIMKLSLKNRNASFTIFNLIPQPGSSLFSVLIPHSEVNSESSVDDWIRYLDNPNYYVNTFVKNKIDPEKFKVCKFYFNAFFLLHEIADLSQVSRFLPKRLTLLSRPPFCWLVWCLKMRIYLRFKIGTTALPFMYWIAKYSAKLIWNYDIDDIELLRDNGMKITGSVKVC